ncbi:GATA zinc finger domain-containing protein 14-like isoform X1 [Bombus impatiens]|uniref:GATA zinc finger domain-containing protein 14-like isoform X1 n=2 Tax=Bombus impatiens TaxID=132113 RepID=A0A6P3DP03_BOMIM|nr:GATA zinc finger domain-containing protein 14-like isoform X1 [Bombus impatiens]
MSSASTGGTEGSSPASSPASATSLTMAAPKYGTLVPNRIFVGGISANTSVEELAELFSSYGNVKATKIIADRAGVSKGYGFVTFETEEEAKRLQQESECIVLRERKLNIAPAIKKQPFNRSLDGGSGSPPSVPTSTYYYPNGMGLTYQNGMTFYNTTAPTPTTPIAPPTDPATIYQATGVFGPQAAGHQTFTPVMYPCPAPSLYMPQQYQYSPMPYECYAGAVAAGAHQYLYPTNNSQNSTSGGNSNSGSGNNGTGATSPPTGPPQPIPSLPPPPPTHFYPSAAPPPHHHPPVPAGPAPPQMDHIYYPFAAGPHPPPPPHASMGLTDQQLLLFPTDASCQQTSSSDGQVAPQEDSRSTSSHSEQAHGETQAASGSATPLVSLMPVKFPMSGRYTNYHPIAIHTANLYSSQTCLNETDDCSGNQMHCRAIVYHPAAVYIPHTHTSPFHNASGGTSLLPTPPSISQQLFDSSNKNQCFNSRDYTKSGNVNGQNNYSKSQNHGIALSHQNPFFRAQNVGNSQPYKHSNIDGSYKYTTPAMSSRFSMQYSKKAVGSNVGSPASFVAQRSSENYNQKSFGSNTTSGQQYNSTNTQKMFNSAANFDYANGRKTNSGGDQYFENATKPNNYPSRKNTTNYRNNGVIAGQTDGGNNSNSQSNDKYVTNIENENSNSQGVQGTENSSSEKPVSPPPAPYSPMTRPLPNLSPPTSQVQFYNPAQNRYQPSLAPSQHQQQPQQSNAQRRYTIAPALTASRKPTEKYANSNSQAATTTMLRQNKYKVNGIIQAGNKVADDSLGGAGDAPPGVGRMPITPPGTPRTHPGHPAGDQGQLSDACHQMQALTL